MRILVKHALHSMRGAEPSRPECQLVQAVAKLETGYGDHWHGAGIGSNNMGAIQAGGAWHGDTFSYTDTSPNDDGSSTPYVTKFRKYGTPEAGTLDLCKVVLTGGKAPGREKLVAPAAAKGDAHGFSAGLYDTVYYQGFGRTRTERISHHVTAVLNACNAMALALGEPMPDGSDPVAPVHVFKLGDTEATWPGVKNVQRVVGVAEDGAFGPRTLAAVVAWQKKHRLNPDGKFGPVSQKVALEEP
jgi:peptidoglycan hydrolase-like protein with peptidoglycan-binding domain